LRHQINATDCLAPLDAQSEHSTNKLISDVLATALYLFHANLSLRREATKHRFAQLHKPLLLPLHPKQLPCLDQGPRSEDALSFLRDQKFCLFWSAEISRAGATHFSSVLLRAKKQCALSAKGEESLCQYVGGRSHKRDLSKLWRVRELRRQYRLLYRARATHLRWLHRKYLPQSPLFHGVGV